MSILQQDFVFSSPTKTIFGRGVLSNAGKECSLLGKKPLVVTDSFLSGTENFKKFINELRKEDLEVVVFDKTVPNPLDIHIEEGVDLFKKNKCDMLIGYGGGSSIDSAKTIGAIITNGENIHDVIEEDSIKIKTPPLVAVPTTAGTGSEVTIYAVITESKSHEKLILFSDKIIPDVALLDPEITVTMPKMTTAYTGIDAFIHAFEAYTNNIHNPIGDVLALKAMELIGDNIKKAVTDPEDLDARSAMLLGSHMAGIAFSNQDLGAIHTMGETLASAVDIPHGLSMVFFFPYILRAMTNKNSSKIAEIAREINLSNSADDRNAAGEFLSYMSNLIKNLDFPVFSSIEKINKSDLIKLAKLCKEHPCDSINAFEMSEKDYLDTYERAYANELDY